MTAFGRPRRHFRVMDSTNERARELALEGAPGGTVVTAEEQTSGRGRRGRAWAAPPGKALLYSAILRPLGREHALLPLAVPLAVCEAVESLAPLECRVKWPNDVWIDGAKGRGGPARGPSARLGGDRDRPQPGDRARPSSRPICAGRRPRLGRESPPPWRWGPSTKGSGSWVDAVARGGCWRSSPTRDALRGREIRWEDAGAGLALGHRSRRGDRRPRQPARRRPMTAERLSLGAGEVQLASEHLAPAAARGPPRSRAPAPSPAPGSRRSPGAR